MSFFNEFNKGIGKAKKAYANFQDKRFENEKAKLAKEKERLAFMRDKAAVMSEKAKYEKQIADARQAKFNNVNKFLLGDEKARAEQKKKLNDMTRLW